MELHWIERLRNQKISWNFIHSPNEFTKTHRSKSLNLSLKGGVGKMILGARSLYFALSEGTVMWRSRWVTFKRSNVSGLAIIKYVITTFVYNGLDCGRLVVPGGHQWSKMVWRWHQSDFTHHINIIRHSLSEYWNSKSAKNCHLESLLEIISKFWIF